MSTPLPPLDTFLQGAGPAAYAGEPDVHDLPIRDRSMPGSVVGRRHTTLPTVVNVVDSEGRGFPVDLNQVSQANMAAAAVSPNAYGSGADSAVATFYRLAQQQQRTQAAPNPNYTGVQVTNLLEQPQVQRRRATAVPSVGQPEARPYTSAPAAPPPSQGYREQTVVQRPSVVAPPQSSMVAAPSQQVTYEIPGYGPLDNFYHQIIRTGEHLVLVFDRRFNGQQGFPRHSQSELGMRVHGTDKLFTIRTTGIEFVLDNQALCLLEVIQEGSYSQYMAQNDPLAQAMNAVPPYLEQFSYGEESNHRAGDYAPGIPGATDHDRNPTI